MSIPRVRLRPSAAAWLLAAACAIPGRAAHAGQDTLRAMLTAKFQHQLDAMAAGFEGIFAAQVVDLTDGVTVGVNAGLVLPQGSAIKIPILLELFRRADQRPGYLAERRAVTDAVRTGGSGIIQRFGNGTSELALEDLAILMIVLSDNTATNMLIDEVGMDAVNSGLDALGMRSTRLRRKMIRPEASVRGEENVSTAAEAAGFMARLARCDLPVSQASCRRMRGILEIPKGGPVRAPVPASVPIAFKPGGIEGVTTVWALVNLPGRPYALSVMTTYGGDGGEAVRRASAAAYEYFSRLAGATPYGTRVPVR
ncbi:MAG TPA: serine hydrolase [Gemmatimonadales bacterium]|nr:serine hydrolase [Gemmatimonadales bacterium]